MKNKRITESLLWAGASLCAVLAIVFSSMQGNMDSLRLADIVRPLVALGSLAARADPVADGGVSTARPGMRRAGPANPARQDNAGA